MASYIKGGTQAKGVWKRDHKLVDGEVADLIKKVEIIRLDGA